MLSAFHFVFLRDSECQVIFPFSGQVDGTETLVLPVLFERWNMQG